jgi:hypothetical protein
MFIHDKFTHGNLYFHPFESLEIDGESVMLISLLYELMDDDEIMPHSLSGLLDMPVNSTYADAALKIMAELGH